MNIRHIFPKIIALVTVFAVIFGFAAPYASAAQSFAATRGATLSTQYYTDLEVGITHYDVPTKTMTPLCNNRYGTGAGPEWRGQCTQGVNIQPSEEFLIESYSKPAGPGGTCWTKATMSSLQVISPIPGNNRYLTTVFSKSGTVLAQITLDGLGLASQGEKTNPKPPFTVCP